MNPIFLIYGGDTSIRSALCWKVQQYWEKMQALPNRLYEVLPLHFSRLETWKFIVSSQGTISKARYTAGGGAGYPCPRIF